MSNQRVKQSHVWPRHEAGFPTEPLPEDGYAVCVRAVGLPHPGPAWVEVTTVQDLAAGLRIYVPSD